MKPYIPTLVKVLALAILLLHSPYFFAQAMVSQPGQVEGTVVMKGLSDSHKDYYRNLIMQDIALPQLFPASRVTFSMKYRVSYQVRRISTGKFEISIHPSCLECQAVDYFGFDISSTVLPHEADVTFLLLNQFGFEEDSVVFTGIPLGDGPGVYVTKTIQTFTDDPQLKLKTINLLFTEDSYIRFRDEVSTLDNYFAASAILDSLQLWTAKQFPSGNGTLWGNFLQQLEIRRIQHHIDASSFVHTLKLNDFDPAGYLPLREMARRKHVRALTILERQITEENDAINSRPAEYWISMYYDWITGYQSRAYTSDYRFSNYFMGMEKLAFSNGMLSRQRSLLENILSRAEGPCSQAGKWFLIGKALSDNFVSEAKTRKKAGETVRALSLYSNARWIREFIPGPGEDPSIAESIRQLQAELAGSYLNLSRLAAIKGNKDIAERYLEEARVIHAKQGVEDQSIELISFEQELLDLFFQHAREMVSQNNFRQAREYIAYLNEKCSLGKYDCTSEIKTLSREADKGWYDYLLEKAIERLNADEPLEARAFLEDARTVRYNAIGNIDRDIREVTLASQLNQLEYEDIINEGLRYLNYGNYNVSLYYLNRASAMQSGALVELEENLEAYLRQAARPVIVELIELGKVRARGYYFDEGWEILEQCHQMMENYLLGSDSLLMSMMAGLETILRSSQCVDLKRDYQQEMARSREKESQGQYIDAMYHVNRAIELILDDTVCYLDDQEAWYARAALEYPVEYEKRRNEAMKLIPADAEGFVKAYAELGRYYHSRRLQDKGVVHTPMHEPVMQSEDKLFLVKMLEHYYNQKEKLHTLDVMKELWSVYQYVPSSLQQKQLGQWLAAADMEAGCDEPLVCLNSYVPVNSSYKTLRYQYKFTWIKKSGWKFRYLSLLLKNKPSNNQ